MKKAKAGSSNVSEGASLFRKTITNRLRRLVLGQYLQDQAFRRFNQSPEVAAAHQILVRWADLESSGELKRKETSLDDSFRQEILGQALRYTMATANPKSYHLEKSFFIPGIGTPDAVLGGFPPVDAATIGAVVELKDASADLDHDKFNGRTAVQQCWDYLNNLPNCVWGIVSNFVTFRLYHRTKTQQAYEQFQLQDLRDPEEFARFYYLFERGGLLANHVEKIPRAQDLILRTEIRQRDVGDELYAHYSEQRLRLIRELITHHGRTQDQALRAAQKLLDRIIFIAFCEDRGLLPSRLIHSTWSSGPPLARVTNPRWRAFLDTFYAIDKGHPNLDLPTGYNGGLFAHDDNVDNLNLGDEWTNIFEQIGQYDFAEDVNVDVLGHIFEKSVSEIEKLRTTGALLTADPESAVTMPKSAERKRFGIYYTPPDFTSFIVRQAIGVIIDERFAELAKSLGVNPDLSMQFPPSEQFAQYWEQCLIALRQITVVDPACGSGAFLIAAYELLENQYQSVVVNLARHTGKPASTWNNAIPEMILGENLHGMDLSPEAVEITQLALWIRSARKGRRLDDLTHNIVCGNSLVTDPAVHPRAQEWDKTFPRIFARPGGAGFDCVIGNPPWERMKLQEREFFAFAAPEIAGAVNAADRRKLISQLGKEDPELHRNYEQAKTAAERTLDHVRTSGNFPLTGRGDINTYMVFAELAKKIVRPTGRVGLLVPSGIATDDTTKGFFNELMQAQSLISLYDFENKEAIFPDVHRSFKFSAIIFGGDSVKTPKAKFVFFARNMQQVAEKWRQIELSAKDLSLLNPNTHTCPIFRSRRDAELTKALYKRVPILIDRNRKSGGNSWGILFFRMFDQTNDAELFKTAKDLKAEGFKQDGNGWIKRKEIYLPLYEAKMIQAYDHRAASVVVEAGNWMRQGQTEPTSRVEHQNPEFLPWPRFWIGQEHVEKFVNHPPALLAYKDVTSATNQRTMIAALVPKVGLMNSAPFIRVDDQFLGRRQCCLLANLNSLAFDFIARQKVGGLHLNFFIVEQLPTFPPDTYVDRCPWDKKQTLEKWISERVLKLTCTADDMRPFAEAAGFKEGVHKWKEDERTQLRAELDAAFFHLYGISREDAEYILFTFQGMSDDDGETFTPTSAASLILDLYDQLSPA